MAAIKCFMLTPTKRCFRWLRRYYSRFPELACEPFGYHNAMVRIEDGLVFKNAAGRILDQGILVDDQGNPADSRWPTKCDKCDFMFDDKCEYQLFTAQIYKTPDGSDVTIRTDLGDISAPPGAIYDSPWLLPHYAGPDGRCLMITTPGGVWFIDGPSTNGDGWTRTGEPPMLTASPSILIEGKYHGWLRNGELVEC